MTSFEVPKVLILGNAQIQGFNERVFGSNVQTLDIMDVEGTSSEAIDARSRHFKLDLDDVSSFNDFIDSHKEYFTIILFDFSVWKFVRERFRMIRLTQALKSKGKLYIVGAEVSKGGTIGLPPNVSASDWAYRWNAEQKQAQIDQIHRQNVQDTLSIFQNRRNIKTVYAKTMSEILSSGSDDTAIWSFLQTSTQQKNLPTQALNSTVVVVEKN